MPYSLRSLLDFVPSLLIRQGRGGQGWNTDGTIMNIRQELLNPEDWGNPIVIKKSSEIGAAIFLGIVIGAAIMTVVLHEVVVMPTLTSLI